MEKVFWKPDWNGSKIAIFIYFWPPHVACGILVLQPGIKPTSPALEAGSLNHWTAREVPVIFLIIKKSVFHQ